MQNIYQWDLEEYLIRSAVNGVYEHVLKANVDSEGNVSFKITDASTDPYVCEFAIYGNILVTCGGEVIQECDVNGVPFV
jgi:hypothetical protein